MPKQLDKTYDPKSVEGRTYDFWQQSGYFHTEIDPAKKPYTIVMPPPNITGQLHMGHALDNTLQDILIRFRRMQGYAALWLPGTDHASIATEAKIVEADGARKGSPRRTWAGRSSWSGPGNGRRQYGGRIVQQLKKLGSSCDWERERFTMDEGCSKAVREVFVRLYEKGLIYRGERIINWCPHCHTVHLRRGGGIRGAGRPSSGISAIPLTDGSGVSGAGYHPAGDHAGRYGCGGASRR